MFTYQYTNITSVMRRKEGFNEVFANSYVKYREKNSGVHLVLLDKTFPLKIVKLKVEQLKINY